jgi:PAS domain S-box-containing protein
VYLNHIGRYLFSGSLLLVLIYSAILYTIIDGAGFSDAGVVALPLFIVFVSLLFDRRPILAATALSVLSLVALFYLARSGRLVLSQTPGVERLITISILVAATGVAAWLSADLRERNLADLISRESRFRTLFDESTDAIFILEADTFIDGNAGTLRMFGADRDQIVGKTPYAFSPPTQRNGQPSRELALEKIRRAHTEGPQRFEWQHRRLDGSLFDVEVNLNRAKLEGRPVLLAIVRDLTERKLAEEATQEERQRLARDLHDAVSQTLWSASLIADVLPELWEQDQQKGRDLLRRLRQLTHGALAEMRALLLELRPSALVEQPLGELLQRMCEAVSSRTGWQVRLHTAGECSLEPDVHIGFYRLAQEALNNAARHATATTVEVELHCEPDRATLTVRDDGRGFDPSSSQDGQHLGLGIMRERAASIGAALMIESRPGAGTRIEVHWPA